MLKPHNRDMDYNELFVKIGDGTIKLPKFQREFIWNKEQTAGLLDSLVKGFPIGTFTHWETTDQLRNIRNIGNHQLKQVPKGHPIQYVLDGQQRITSLYAVKVGSVFQQPRGPDIDYKDISIDLSFDPDTEETVVFPVPPSDRPTISVHELLNGSLVEIFREFEDVEQQTKIEGYKQRLESYVFPVVVIGKQYSIDIAVEVFTRINTSGTELSLFEIMVAKTYSEERKFDLADEYAKLINGGNNHEKSLKDVDYDTVDSATVLRCVAMFLGRETTRKQILKIDRDEFIDAWPEVTKAIFKAVTYFKQSMKIPVSRLLPYQPIMVLFTYFLSNSPRPNREQKKRLNEYFWWASMSRRFNSGVDTGLTADRRRMDDILVDRVPSYRGETVEFSRDDLIELEFTTGEARCKALLCLYCYYKPKSFDTNEEVCLDNTWLSRIDSKNYHHFFPRNYLKNDYEDWYANSIINITIVDEYLNKKSYRH